MENKIEVNALLDCYGGLLTEKQQEICRYYYRDDLSYQEIAGITGTSRSAVYDIVKRCRQDLRHYEEILQIHALSEKRMNLYQQMRSLSTDSELNRLIDECENTENEGGDYE